MHFPVFAKIGSVCIKHCSGVNDNALRSFSNRDAMITTFNSAARLLNLSVVYTGIGSASLKLS
jgi:hypothetical protein